MTEDEHRLGDWQSLDETDQYRGVDDDPDDERAADGPSGDNPPLFCREVALPEPVTDRTDEDADGLDEHRLGVAVGDVIPVLLRS